MNELRTAEGYFKSTVSDDFLDEIKENLQDSSNELVAYSFDELNGDVTVILDMTDLGVSSQRYIH